MKLMHTYGNIGGIGLLMIGLLFRYYISKRRFNRRNVAGLQQFRSYKHALWTSAWEQLGMFAANLLITAGGLLLAAANIYPL